MTRSFLLCALALVTLSSDLLISSTSATPIIPFAPKRDSKFFWHPTENGGVVPAFLEGGPEPKADESDIKFFLFTLKNQNAGDELVIGDDGKLAASHYVSGAPLKLLTHGFSSSSTGGPGPSFKREYFRGNKNYNVILIDWAPLAAAPWYDTAAAATKMVGQKTANLVNYLVSKGLVTHANIHFAGHSLGAHVGGFFGSNIGAGKIGRITALDPALPLFGNADESGRIDPSDAAFVDVVHTSGGTLLDGGLAFREAIGHVDFYPNKGEHQPGCGADAFGACSHGRCYEYMQESINNVNAYLSCRCNTWEEFNLGSCPCTETATMGENVRKNARGKFYLKTNSAEPWSQ